MTADNEDNLVKQVGGSHYNKSSKCPHCQGTIQHWDYAAGLPYLDGQVSKYVDRHLDKNGFQDLLKAQSYLVKTMLHYYPDEYKAWLAEQEKEKEGVNFCSWCPNPSSPDPKYHPKGQIEHSLDAKLYSDVVPGVPLH